MKISLAQIKPEKGNIQANIETYKKWIKIASSQRSDFIVFSELSLTGYEPELSEELAIKASDLRLVEFQRISNLNNISIGLGLPLKSEFGILISMMIFRPHLPKQTYSKQNLHVDEKPFFVNGREQLILDFKDEKLAPAICYESLQEEHSRKAKRLGAEIYITSVAKSKKGIENAYSHYPKIARNLSMTVLMSNCIGFCDNFIGAGQSAVWNRSGELIGKLEEDEEGLLTFDTESQKLTIR